MCSPAVLCHNIHYLNFWSLVIEKKKKMWRRKTRTSSSVRNLVKGMVTDDLTIIILKPIRG